MKSFFFMFVSIVFSFQVYAQTNLNGATQLGPLVICKESNGKELYIPVEIY